MESGEFNCCNPAYGYILKDGQLMINEPQAAIIRRIFDLYLSGVGRLITAGDLPHDLLTVGQPGEGASGAHDVFDLRQILANCP